jgi:NADPH:quinone reductase-like Zn-dependent oxidoreductase
MTHVTVPAPQQGEVRLRVRAIGLNRVELMWREDKCTEPVSFPGHLGYEAAGIVDAVGPDVTHVSVGDPVSTIPAFSMNQYWTYGEVVLVPGHAVVKSPPSLSFEQASSIWMMYLTAYGALVETADLKPDDVVLITAASSSVGLAAIQITNMLGGRPIALTRTGAKAEQLRAAGASHVIATEEQDVVAEVNRITGGVGAQVIFDAVGGPQFEKMMQVLAFRGTALIYGTLSDEPTRLPMIAMIGKLPVVRGHSIWLTASDAQRLKLAIEFIAAGLAAGNLRPVIDKVFPFDQIAEAHRYLARNEHFGKVVVTV